MVGGIGIVVLGSFVPRLLPVFSMLHAERRVALKKLGGYVFLHVTFNKLGGAWGRGYALGV